MSSWLKTAPLKCHYWSEGGTRSVRPEREVSKVSIFKGGEGIGVGAGFPSARGRISVGSGPDFRRLGAGFPSARGRIPVGSGPDSRGPGAERPCAWERSAAKIPKPASVRIELGPGRGPRAALFRNFRENREILGIL